MRFACYLYKPQHHRNHSWDDILVYACPLNTSLLEAQIHMGPAICSQICARCERKLPIAENMSYFKYEKLVNFGEQFLLPYPKPYQGIVSCETYKSHMQVVIRSPIH